MVAALSQSPKYYVYFGEASYSSCLTFMSSFENVCISPLCSQPSVGLKVQLELWWYWVQLAKGMLESLNEEQPRRVRKEQWEAQVKKFRRNEELRLTLKWLGLPWSLYCINQGLREHGGVNEWGALTTSEERWGEGLKLGACTRMCIKRGDGELGEEST